MIPIPKVISQYVAHILVHENDHYRNSKNETMKIRINMIIMTNLKRRLRTFINIVSNRIQLHLLYLIYPTHTSHQHHIDRCLSSTNKMMIMSQY